MGCAGSGESIRMRNHERDRLRPLERRCDWLMARIAIGESQGRDMDRDIAEHSALRWLIDEFGREHVDMLTENHLSFSASRSYDSKLLRPNIDQSHQRS